MKKVIHVKSNDNAPPGFPLVALITLAAMVSVSSKEITKGLAGLANEDHPRSHPDANDVDGADDLPHRICRQVWPRRM